MKLIWFFRKMPFIGLAMLVVMALLSPLAPVNAKPVINDAAALAGLKQAKGVFLLDFQNARKTAFYLKIIEGTHAGFVRQGVKPALVLVFIGPTVQFLTLNPKDEIAMEQEEHLQSIAASVARLNKLGVRLEVCQVANEVFGVDAKTLFPGLTAVGDGFISLIGWQNQGYKLVPVY